MSDEPNTMATRTGGHVRAGNGQYDRDPETAKQDAKAAHLRSRGMTYQQIADELGIAKSSAHDAVQRALSDTLTEPADAARSLELERLDQMYAAVLAVLERQHVTVSQGRIVRRRILDENGDPMVVAYDDDGKPIFREEEIIDDAPVLAAVDRLLKIAERRAKLLGLDAPTKAEIGGTLTYEVVGVDDDRL